MRAFLMASRRTGSAAGWQSIAMAVATLPDSLRRFIDDELLRAPMLLESVIDGALAEMRAGWSLLPPRDQATAKSLQQAAQARRAMAVQRYVQSLREQVDAELRRNVLAPSDAAQPAPPTLSLLDDSSLAADVEISHLIESVKTDAEHELREIAAYTSALMGDADVTRDHNLFRPEVHVRALWEAAQAMPVALGFRIGFLRHAGKPLGQVLRKSYASACARLQADGIVPAAHRTVIHAGSPRRTRWSDSWTGVGPELHSVRDSVPMPLQSASAVASPQPPALEPSLLAAERALVEQPVDETVSRIAELVGTVQRRLCESTPSGTQRQTIEWLCGLFETIVTDPRLPAGVPHALAPLLVSALRQALVDRAALDDYAHPLWRLADRVAMLADIAGDAGVAERDALVRLARGIVEQIAHDPQPDAALCRWALERLHAWEHHGLEKRLARCGAELASLQALERRLLADQPAPGTMSGALDVGQLDTVPAVLLESFQPSAFDTGSDAATWMSQRVPGDWLRVFIQGRWMRAQLLWQSPQGELWLLGDRAGSATWALRRRALERMRIENLLKPLRPRLLAGSAAHRMLSSFGEAQAA
jgi:hypothetical protein